MRCGSRREMANRVTGTNLASSERLTATRAETPAETDRSPEAAIYRETRGETA